MLKRQKQAALRSFPINNEFNTVVAAIETALTKTFKTALFEVDANALDIQKNLNNLTVYIGKVQNILLIIPDVFPKLNDEKAGFHSGLSIINRAFLLSNFIKQTFNSKYGTSCTLSSSGFQHI